MKLKHKIFFIVWVIAFLALIYIALRAVSTIKELKENKNYLEDKAEIYY